MWRKHWIVERVAEWSQTRRTLCLVAAGVLAAPSGGQAQTFMEHLISPQTSAQTAFATDLNGDGDSDVLSARASSGPGANGKLSWYESDGGAPPAFTERIISTTAFASEAYPADVNGDGHTDVLSASSLSDRLAWWENDGGSPPAFTEHIISALEAFSVYATDVDGDGDIDVLSGVGDSTIAWYEHDGGSPPTFTEHIISTTALGAPSVYATDVDGDGDTDALSASFSDDKIAWYENHGGAPPTFTEHIISTMADGGKSVYATDVDGDGDTDVLSASSFIEEKLAWWENDGGAPPAFTEHLLPLPSANDQPGSVFAMDMDGDGDTDVLAALGASDTIAWYENDGGAPPAFTLHLISTTAQGARSVHAADVDGDGDTDVLSASFLAGIAWYEQLGSPVGAQVNGVTLARGACLNLTTGSFGSAPAEGDSWFCAALGVTVSDGERVTLSGVGLVDGSGSVGGSVSGLASPSAHRVECRNVTTAQVVEFPASGDAWDCEAEGLIVLPGDKVVQEVRGEV